MLGAAIYCLGGTLNITNSLIAGNSAIGGGGSALGSGFPANYSGRASGGAIYVEGAKADLQSVTLTNNNASAGTAGFSPLGSGNGGNAVGGALFASNSVILMGDCIISSNSAVVDLKFNRPSVQAHMEEMALVVVCFFPKVRPQSFGSRLSQTTLQKEEGGRSSRRRALEAVAPSSMAGICRSGLPGFHRATPWAVPMRVTLLLGWEELSAQLTPSQSMAVPSLITA